MTAARFHKIQAPGQPGGILKGSFWRAIELATYGDRTKIPLLKASARHTQITVLRMHLFMAEFFDHTYVINLEARTDRRREMTAQFRRIGIRLPHPKVTLFPAVRPPAPGGFPSIGARGCFLSHLRVLDDVAQRGFSRILICEDDLNFIRDFNRLSAVVLQRLAAEDWSFFYGGSSLANGLEHDGPTTVYLPHTTAVITSHFLGLQSGVVDPLRRYLNAILSRSPGDPRGGPMHVDGAYTRFRHDHPQFRTIMATPPLGYQRPSKSDIADPKWHDRLPIFAKLTALARRGKARLTQS